VTRTYGNFFASLSRVSADKTARDVLDETKVHEQVALFCKLLRKEPEQFLPGKKILEIGSGYCVFLAVTRRDYDLESYGAEPATAGFDSSFAIGREVLAEYGQSPDIVRNACAEALPWPDNFFDLAYSTNVLEHVGDPDQVMRETIRVLKPGGYAQFVFPNYDSLFDGHYALPWLPHSSKMVAKLWVRLWGRDPAFIDTLQLLTEKDARRWASWPEIEVLGFGQDVFMDRMQSGAFSSWAGLGMVKAWVNMARRAGLARVCAKALVAFRAYTPIILSFRKRTV
jgi:SAM-dependent methyltransferase